MVDTDRFDDLFGGEDESDGSDDSSNESFGESNQNDKKQTKKQQIESYKNQKSSTTSSSTEGGTEDIKRLLFCLGNMDAYTRVVIDYDFPQLNKAQKGIKEEFAKDVSGEIVNFLGLFDIDDVCDKYGYSWKNVLETSIESQDMVGKTLQTNPGNPSKGDVRDLLDAIANVILYIEGNYRDKKNQDNKSQREATIEVVSENIYESYKTIIGRTNVQTIAEKHGYDWQEDILEGVLDGRDGTSKLT